MTKDRQPGLWDSSASGHVDAGEDYDACAVRELREEIGLRLSAAPQRLFKLAASAETDQEHVWVYRCEAEGPFACTPRKSSAAAGLRREEVTRWMAERPQDFAGAPAGRNRAGTGHQTVSRGSPSCFPRGRGKRHARARALPISYCMDTA